ncbi:MAG: hypothetical protein HY919_02875 [Elusimicrobia bacterium]|nr:hypothetical protein [Elusimicrobiota bacterium]
MNIIKFLINWKYRHFLKKLAGIDKIIADLTFKRFKTDEIREEVRQELDNLQAKLAAITAVAETPEIIDQKVILARDIKRLKDQIIGIDLEITGSKPTNQYPDGIQGINGQIGAYNELKKMIKEYIKSEI